MYRQIHIYLSLSLLLFGSQFVFAEDTLADLSFADLMDVEVYVASKTSESIYDAPGMITSFSNKDLQIFGCNTLKDLANITPGFSSTRLYGESGFETRGVMTSSFNNNRHLVLLDGIPVNHIRANKAPVGEELSLYGAKQVEFLRGPASSLYGTGAYYGVINIVPMVPHIKGTLFRSSLGFAGPTSQRVANGYTGYRGEKQTFWAVASYNQKEASKTLVGSNANENHRYWDDLKAVSVQGSYQITEGMGKGIGAGAYYLSRATGLGEHWNGDFSHETNNLHWETFIAFLRFDRSITDIVSLNTYLKYNRSTETGTFTPLSDSSFSNFNGTGELLYDYEVPVVGYQYYADIHRKGSVLDVTGGVDLEWRYQAGTDGGTALYIVSSDSGKEPYIMEETPSKRSPDFKTASAFLQLKSEFPVLSGLQLTGGVRTDFGQGGDNQYTQLSPRLGAVQKFSDHLNLKMLYGTALSAPGIKEILLNEETKNSSPDLAPQIVDLSAETFSTFEAGLVFHKPIKTETHIFHTKAEVAGFVNQSVDKMDILKMKNSKGKEERFFINTKDTIIARGVECELRGETDFGITVLGSYAFAKARNRINVVMEDIPMHKIYGGLAYHSEKTGVYTSILGHFVREYSTSKGAYLDGVSTADIVVGWKSSMGLGTELKMTNILDEKYNFPVGSTPVIPLERRQIMMSLTSEF